MEHGRVDWLDLYPDLLSEIADHLETRQDVINFRAVCKKWRVSFPLSSQILKTLPILSPLLPLELFPDQLSSGVDHFMFRSFPTTFHYPLHLVTNAVYLIQSSASHNSWLATVEELNPGKLSLRFPLTGTLVNGFPESFPKSLQLSGFRVSELARGYNFRSAKRSWDLTKVVLFTNPSAVPPLTIDDCTLMVLTELGCLWWGRFSVGQDWGCVNYGNVSKFDDIVEFKDCVYAVDHTGKVYAIHYDSVWTKRRHCNFQGLRMECIVDDSICSGCNGDRRKRLVVDDTSGVLYLVERRVYCHDRIHFKVYKLDEGGCKWEEVGSLGENRVLFVGVDWCFFASASDFPGCRGDRIFFLKNSFPQYGRTSSDEAFFKGSTKGLEVGVFHFKDGDAGLISAYPGYSNILWPPPAWLCTKSFSSKCV